MVIQKFDILHFGANGHPRVPPTVRHHGDELAPYHTRQFHAEHASRDTCGFVCPISDTVSYERDRTRKVYDQ